MHLDNDGSVWPKMRHVAAVPNQRVNQTLHSGDMSAFQVVSGAPAANSAGAAGALNMLDVVYCWSFMRSRSHLQSFNDRVDVQVAARVT